MALVVPDDTVPVMTRTPYLDEAVPLMYMSIVTSDGVVSTQLIVRVDTLRDVNLFTVAEVTVDMPE
jgi:hypothetical protein